MSNTGTALIKGKFERLIKILLVIESLLKAFHRL